MIKSTSVIDAIEIQETSQFRAVTNITFDPKPVFSSEESATYYAAFVHFMKGYQGCLLDSANMEYLCSEWANIVKKLES